MEELKGLTTEEIEEKTKQGKTNKIKIKANESILKIIRKNITDSNNRTLLVTMPRSRKPKRKRHS